MANLIVAATNIAVFFMILPMNNSTKKGVMLTVLALSAIANAAFGVARLVS